MDDPDQASDTGRFSAIVQMKISAGKLARYIYSKPPDAWNPGEIVRYGQMLAQEMIDQDLLREQQILRLRVIQARIAYLVIVGGVLLCMQAALIVGFAIALLRY